MTNLKLIWIFDESVGFLLNFKTIDIQLFRH